MSVYPRNLSNFLNRMSGYNKNSVKMNVLGSSEANNGDVVQVDLPTNSIVDLSSLAWSFDVEYNAEGLANAKTAACPLNCESVIERLAIEVNGQTLVNMTNYNVLYHALLYMTATDDYIRSRRVAQTNALGTGGDAGGEHEVLTSSVDADGADGNKLKKTHIVDTWERKRRKLRRRRKRRPRKRRRRRAGAGGRRGWLPRLCVSLSPRKSQESPERNERPPTARHRARKSRKFSCLDSILRRVT